MKVQFACAVDGAPAGDFDLPELPRAGEKVSHSGYEFEVVQVVWRIQDRSRVSAIVHLKRDPTADEQQAVFDRMGATRPRFG